MLVQHGRKRFEGRNIIGAVSGPGNNTLINGFLEIIASGAGGKVGVAQILFTNQSGKVVVCFFPCIPLDVFERQKDDRVLTLIIPIFLSASPDRFVGKVFRGIFIGLFKEDTEHIHIERFAEPSGARKQRDHRALVQKVFDHQRFIDVIVFRRCKAIIGNADREGKMCRHSRFFVSPCTHTSIGRFLCIDRNLPTAIFLARTGNLACQAERSNSSCADSPQGRSLFCGHHDHKLTPPRLY